MGEDPLERALALHRAQQVPLAHALYLEILERDPGHADALHLCGVAAHQLGRVADGIEQVRRAIDVRPDVAVYHQNLGIMQLDLGCAEAASAAIDGAFRLALERGEGDVPDARHATLHKLRHDWEQLRYLESRGVGAPWAGALADRYAAVLAALPTELDPAQIIELDAWMCDQLGDGYNRPLHIAEAPALPGSPLHPSLDFERLARAYLHSDVPVAVSDSLLAPEALQTLRNFCLESTFWFEFRHRGYLGSRLASGFNCPLLLQVAIELRQRLPEVLGPHPLQQIWAFKYTEGTPGIAPHADAAAVNINFWLTADEANLEPQRGGLVLYDEAAPADWAFEDYNRSPERARELLRQCGAGYRTIPHRQNRMVLFKSRLFHETDSVPFRPGYANRRINVTLLYGR